MKFWRKLFGANPEEQPLRADIHAVREQIAAIVDDQIEQEKKSPYDWKVAVKAAWAAQSAFEAVPVEGEAEAYVRAVIDKLVALRERYNDPDGEYTSGKGEIGSIISRIESDLA